MDNNKLSGLPEGLLSLTSLTHLSLRHNNFSNLPYRFGDLHCLKKLDLGENMLKTLPPTMVRIVLREMPSRVSSLDQGTFFLAGPDEGSSNQACLSFAAGFSNISG